ncbi:hypothetical protein EV702DRAFT_1201613 [Suillus placidus]|uniref:Uncharacterized protein n=1 Tax=Suillus placidus TaxID=48579 RepID=A0A9P6ZMG9_9AGAM|nr:hypothetical protein EV702DRAFT_1201613 [Suillus placidus]
MSTGLCQQGPDQDETEEATNVQAEYDSIFTCKCAGQWLRAGVQHLISKYCPMSNRSSAIGCLAEIIAGMKAPLMSSTEPLMDLFCRALSDPELEVQSNACFSIGPLVEHSEINISLPYMRVLSVVRLPFEVSPIDPSVNSMQRTTLLASLPVSSFTTLLPPLWIRSFPALIGSLILKTDYLENRSVFHAIFHLF